MVRIKTVSRTFFSTWDFWREKLKAKHYLFWTLVKYTFVPKLLGRRLEWHPVQSATSLRRGWTKIDFFLDFTWENVEVKPVPCKLYLGEGWSELICFYLNLIWEKVGVFYSSMCNFFGRRLGGKNFWSETSLGEGWGEVQSYFNLPGTGGVVVKSPPIWNFFGRRLEWFPIEISFGKGLFETPLGEAWSEVRLYFKLPWGEIIVWEKAGVKTIPIWNFLGRRLESNIFSVIILNSWRSLEWTNLLN